MVSSFTKRAAICVALFVLASSLPVTAVFQFVPAAQAKMRQDKLTIEPAGGGAGHTFDIQVATTDQEKALGLMFRTKLGDAEGMLFSLPCTANTLDVDAQHLHIARYAVHSAGRNDRPHRGARRAAVGPRHRVGFCGVGGARNCGRLRLRGSGSSLGTRCAIRYLPEPRCTETRRAPIRMSPRLDLGLRKRHMRARVGA